MSLTHIGGVLSAQYNGLNYPVTTVEYLVVVVGGWTGDRIITIVALAVVELVVLQATNYSITLGSSITVTVGAWRCNWNKCNNESNKWV